MTQLEEAGNAPRPDLSGNRMFCLSVICSDRPHLCEQDSLSTAFQENAPHPFVAQNLGIPIQEAAVSLGRKIVCDTLMWFSWVCPRPAWKQEAKEKMCGGETDLRFPASVPAGGLAWLGGPRWSCRFPGPWFLGDYMQRNWVGGLFSPSGSEFLTPGAASEFLIPGSGLFYLQRLLAPWLNKHPIRLY